VMGAWMAIDFLKTKLQGKKDNLDNDKTNKNEGKDPDPQQQQEANNNADEVGDNAQAANQGEANRLGNDNQGQPNVDVPNEDAIPNAQANANADQVSVQNEIAGDNMQGAINESASQLDALAEIGTNPSLEGAEQNLLDANTNLPDAVNTGDFTQVTQNLTDATTNINTAVEQMDVPDTVKDQIKESQQAQQEFQENSEEAQESAETTESGEGEFEGEFIE